METTPEKRCQELAAEALRLLREAEKIADEHKVSFRFYPAYGMGGTYEGNPDDRYDDSEDGWQPSSSGC